MDTCDASMRSIRRDMRIIKAMMIVSSYLSIAIFFMLVDLTIGG